jgi:hypothetical protein
MHPSPASGADTDPPRRDKDSEGWGRGSAQGGMSFRRSMGAMWLYTALRFGLFFALFGLLWLVGVTGFLGAVIALALSVPLSFVLLARPRHAFAAVIEQRVEARKRRQAEIDAELQGDDG